jgi:polyferredoxin
MKQRSEEDLREGKWWLTFLVWFVFLPGYLHSRYTKWWRATNHPPEDFIGWLLTMGNILPVLCLIYFACASIGIALLDVAETFRLTKKMADNLEKER